MSEQIRIAIAVVESGGRFLVGRRPPDKPVGGVWEFPGGKLEAGETDLEAAVRECAEESGLQVTVVGRYLPVEHQYDHADLHLSFVACVPAGQTEPAGRFGWVARKELANLQFPAANAQLLTQLLDEYAPDSLAEPSG